MELVIKIDVFRTYTPRLRQQQITITFQIDTFENKILHMKRILLVLLGFLPWVSMAESRLPHCQGSHLTVVWNACFGVITQSNGDKLIGEFKEGRLDGQGMETAANGHRYVGFFKAGLPDGQGTETFPEGHKFEGEFKEGRYHGQGRFTFSGGNSFVGSFLNGKPEGKGTYNFSNGDRYEGDFRDGKRSGRGTFAYADGTRYVGEFRDGDFNGLGIEYRADGSVLRSGRWMGGRLAESFAIDASRFQFDAPAQSIATLTTRPSTAVTASTAPAAAVASAPPVEAAPAAAAVQPARQEQASEPARVVATAAPAANTRRTDANPSAPAGQRARRLALVLGNDSYKSAAPLQNARADARAMARSLEAAGFKVSLKLDLTQREMNDALRTFTSEIQGGDEVVLFYAGHGVQVGSGNYLLPIDVRNMSEVQVRDDSVSLQRVLDDVSERKARFSLAIIDACRDNPFKSMGRSIGGGRGLAPAAAAAGQMVVFSAGAGQQALDRLGEKDKDPNGLFTRVFLREMTVPNRPIDQVVRTVRTKVVELASSIGHEQRPALYDESVGEFVFVRK